jgi:hypothetical protein
MRYICNDYQRTFLKPQFYFAYFDVSSQVLFFTIKINLSTGYTDMNIHQVIL